MEVKFSPQNTFSNGLSGCRFDLPQKTFMPNEDKRDVLSFLGLTKTSKKHIFLNPKLLQEINGVNNTETVGKLPEEFISALKETGCPKEKTGEEAKKLMASFTLAAAELREAEKNSLKNRDFQVLELARAIDEAFLGDNLFALEQCFQKLLRLQASYSVFAPVLDKAASHIDTAFKEAGILPEDGKVCADFVLEGGRGYAFRVSFLDSKGERLFHDKLLKLYRSPISDVTAKMAKTVNKYVNEEPEEYFRLCKEKMREHYEANIDYLPNYYNLDPKYLVECKVDDYMLLVEDFQRRQKGKSVKELYDAYNDFTTEFTADNLNHSVFAEANTSMYIKNRAGRMKETSYIEPWFFNLKAGYSMFEFSDDELPRVKKELDIGKYGLWHTDLEHNPGNIVKGRVVDYGGIKIKPKEAQRA